MKLRRGEKKADHRVSVSPRPPISSSSSIITLLTDFGTADYFVGAVKGVILSASPNVRLVDLTHEIPPQNIEAAAFTLLAAYSSFPEGTVHVAVVDPGVGSSRRGLVVVARNQFFVGPDNGIFGYIFEREPDFRAFELTNAKYFRVPVSPTFHGRDVFAPVAGALAKGVRPSEFGREITNPVRLKPLATEIHTEKKTKARAGKSATKEIRARIIHIDRFGNCVTNITPAELTLDMFEAGAYLVVKGRKITSLRNFFIDQQSGRTQKPSKRTKVFCIWGSAGFLEIAAEKRSAAKFLKARSGDPVTVRIGK